MDSLSQAALGAAVGEAVLGRRAGRKAALWGAAVATLPDLDVFVPLGNDVLDFTAHRSATHSLWLMAAAAPLIGWGLSRLHGLPDQWRRWMALAALCLWTHSLLDAFTVYGTRFLWPVVDHPFAVSSVFIIDPAYTLPLLIGVIAALARPGPRGHRWNTLGLALSSAYLVWTVGLQWHVQNLAAASLRDEGIEPERLLTSPAPFNSLLWRNLAMHDGDYSVGYHSLVDGDQGPMVFRRYAGGHELLAPLDTTWAVQRLRWFTHGFYRARRADGRLVMSDLRMGVEGSYFFSFTVGRYGAVGVEPLPGDQTPPPSADMPAQLRWVWRRLWDAGAGAAPPSATPPP